MSSWRWKERSEAPVHTRGQPVALCGTSSDLNLEFGSTPPPLTLPSLLHKSQGSLGKQRDSIQSASGGQKDIPTLELLIVYV